MGCPHDAHLGHDPQRLLDEVRYLAARLHQIGWTGDSAYENALRRCYEIELNRRLDRLAAVGHPVAEPLAVPASV